MIALQTIGSIDMPGQGTRKLPAPRQYLAAVLAWGGLEILADTGRGRAAAVTGWVIVLTGAVFGPFGNKAISLIQTVTHQFAVPPSGSQYGASTTPAPPSTITA